ncbi:MAG: hypothetical protein EWM73_02019 [Nitrospira sp.]|nr:MAG: hypothetical protein EWM73_02019 [Nitrospira sp.]
MAKLKADRIGQSDLLEYLNAYSDFSFELAVLKMLRESGLNCEHGGLYEDAVTKKSREFDIRSITAIQRHRVRLAIECKNIRENFPILISCVPRHEQESYHQVALVTEPESRGSFVSLTIHQSRAKTLSIIGEHSMYKRGEPVGKSTVQVGRAVDGSISANDSELYEKWGQCLSSAADLVERVYWDDDDGNDKQDVYQSMVIPFVVVPNDRLSIVLYDEDGNRVSDPESSNRCSCFIDKDYEMGTKLAGTRMWLSHVEIVTLDGMRSFVQRYLSSEKAICQLFPKEGINAALQRAAETKT